MNRRHFLKSSLAGAGALAFPTLANASTPARIPDFPFEEATVADLQATIQSGKISCEELTQLYLKRIQDADRSGPKLNSIIEINPDAVSIARDRDADSRKGPLHGMPVLIKDNIESGDRMKTTAGSLALNDNIAQNDAPIVKKLRAAGAVLLGKTNLSEWANFRSTHSSSGWSGRGGQTHNPYVLDRNPSGSSSGSGAATSANLCAVSIGTETDGSIVSPSNNCGLVGVKPTLGLVARTGIIPLSHSQDTAGPMCRTVRDAAIVLGVIAGPDAADPATKNYKGESDYVKYLDKGGLKGARIGVARQFFGFSPQVELVMNAAIDAIKRLGAEVIDDVKLPSHGKYDGSEFEVLLYDFKADLNAYLAARQLRCKSMDDIIAFNKREASGELIYFGQEIFEMAVAKGPLTEKKYVEALAKNLKLSRKEGIDAALGKHKLDALIAPTGGPAWTTDWVNGDHFTGGSSTPAAVAGYPAVTVPAGAVLGLPVGLTFFGTAWTEGKLLKYAYAFEQETKARKAPKFLPTLG